MKEQLSKCYVVPIDDNYENIVLYQFTVIAGLWSIYSGQ